jgi:predicted ATPase
MPTLDRIQIEGFKSIRKTDLNLGPVNVLIGANGAGKSNFISAFMLLQRMVAGQLQRHVMEAGGADSLLLFGSKRTSALSLRLHFAPDDFSYRATLAPSSDDLLFFAQEEWGRTPEEWGIVIPHSSEKPVKESALLGDLWAIGSGTFQTEGADESPLRREIRELLRGGRVYHFHDTSSAAKVKLTGDIGDNEALRSDASNLAAFLFLLKAKHPDSYRRIVSTIRLAAPFFDDFRLRPSPFNEQKIQLEWSEKNSDAYFNAHALSDGTLRFICLTTLLLQPELPPLIIIDEPELGLHPYAIQLFAGLVRSASHKAQVILSTQSVTLVNQFTPEELIVVDRKDGASEFRRLSPKDLESWLESYSLGELWEKNVLGGRPG